MINDIIKKDLNKSTDISKALKDLTKTSDALNKAYQNAIKAGIVFDKICLSDKKDELGDVCVKGYDSIFVQFIIEFPIQDSL